MRRYAARVGTEPDPANPRLPEGSMDNQPLCVRLAALPIAAMLLIAQASCSQKQEGRAEPKPSEPKTVEDYLLQAGEYRNSHQHEKALAAFDMAISLNPKSEDAYIRRGMLYLDILHDADKALADWNKAIEIEPNNWWTYSCRGRAYAEKEEYEKAIAEYGEAIKLNVSRSELYSFRGGAYNRLRQYNDAIDHFTKAIALKKTNAAAFCGRGFSYLHREDNDKAIADFNVAIRLNPKDECAYAALLGRAKAYENKGDRERAKHDVAEAQRLEAALKGK
jgi:tetratricopeptide (TPR) repeat protein